MYILYTTRDICIYIRDIYIYVYMYIYIYVCIYIRDIYIYTRVLPYTLVIYTYKFMVYACTLMRGL